MGREQRRCPIQQKTSQPIAIWGRARVIWVQPVWLQLSRERKSLKWCEKAPVPGIPPRDRPKLTIIDRIQVDNSQRQVVTS